MRRMEKEMRREENGELERWSVGKEDAMQLDRDSRYNNLSQIQRRRFDGFGAAGGCRAVNF
jgi:hypothetical protein